MSIVDWDIYKSGDVLDLNIPSPANFIDDIKMDYIKPMLPDNGIIVEVGAGSGRLLTRIGLENKEKYRLIGIDYSPTATKIIKSNQYKFDLNGDSICGDAFCIPLKNNSVDVVCSGGLLEHFTMKEVLVVLNEMNRILKPGALLYADIVPRKRTLCRPFLKEHVGGYENDFDKLMWNNLLTKNEFIDINIFSGLILPPDFYGRFTKQKRIHVIYSIKKIIKSLDNTFLSNWLGFAYIVFARSR